MREGFKAGIITPILLIVVFGLILAANYIPDRVLGLNQNPYIIVVIITILTYAIPTVFYRYIRGADFTQRMRISVFGTQHILYLFHASVFMLSGVVLVSMLMYNISPEAFSASSVSEYAAFAMNDRFFDTLYIIAAFALLPAVTEEMLFRGVVIGEYDRYGAPIACIMSAVVFAMSHFSFVRFPIYLFSGLVLSVVFFTTRSVFASIIVHAINNTVVLLCEKYVLHIVDKQNISFVLLIILLGGAAIVSAALMSLEAHSIYSGYADSNTPSEYAAEAKYSLFARIAEAFFTPTFLILVIMFIAASVSG